MNKNLLFRSIPKVDILLEEQEIQDLIDAYGRELVMDVIREEMDALRTFIGKCEEEEKAKAQIGMLTQNIKRHAGKLHEPTLTYTFRRSLICNMPIMLSISSSYTGYLE